LNQVNILTIKMKLSNVICLFGIWFLQSSQAEMISSTFTVKIPAIVNPDISTALTNATLTIALSEAAVDNQTSYFNTTMQFGFPPQFVLQNGSLVQAQVVLGLPHSLNIAAASDPGDCSKVLGNDCLLEIRNNYFNQVGNRTFISAFPVGSECQKQFSGYTTSSPGIGDVIVGKF
jgi:hypothetical protein